uniref:Uncharacterized protein n=1 Tax=Anguilla anguilla TaxID=7936 RepID=A0A0E9Q1E6_ANGAN
MSILSARVSLFPKQPMPSVLPDSVWRHYFQRRNTLNPSHEGG